MDPSPQSGLALVAHRGLDTALPAAHSAHAGERWLVLFGLCWLCLVWCWLGFVVLFVHLFDSLRRGSLLVVSGARPEGRVFVIRGVVG